ncbi:type VI secretion system-associated protein TagF [Pseudoduganella sp. OTU4001]|uniref:type VI secretion system-associated protein TagF n=1 Tax=Pseudoduganella sp. OTU4001 TaxID=3043854 RepID=UPI00313D0A9C
MTHIAYFGKLPGCGDFVRSAGDQVLVELSDQWLATVMQRLSANPRWRQHYDACAPLDFAFVGTRSRQLVSGHLLASRDQSERRFPFVCMAVHQVKDARGFLPCSPLALAPAWSGLAAAALAAQPGDCALPGQIPDLAAARAALDDYLAVASLGSLQMQLGGAPVRRLMLALGQLLSPLRQQARVPSHCLALPLPQEAAQRPHVAAFWMTLAAPILLRHDLELAMFIADVAGRPMLVLGLDGANPASLQALIDPDAAADAMVMLDDCAWVEPTLRNEPSLQRLGACLEQEQLGLPAASLLFFETFC